jgi:hypothetical protein
MKQIELDLKELTDAGIKQAVDHADSVNEGWSEQAYNVLDEYSQMFAAYPDFQIEEVRDYADRMGLEKPPSNRAWGGVVRRAVKAGLIERVGFKATNNKVAHGSLAAVWKRK